MTNFTDDISDISPPTPTVVLSQQAATYQLNECSPCQPEVTSSYSQPIPGRLTRYERRSYLQVSRWPLLAVIVTLLHDYLTTVL